MDRLLPTTTAASPSTSTTSFVPQQVARWGIASTAKVNRHLLAAVVSSNVARIVAVASRSQEKADIYAKENNIPLSFGSYQSMFESDQIDIVYVSVPNELHKSVTLSALRHKKHVLCEKPLTLTKAEAQEMFHCAAENGVLLAEAVMTLHSGVVKKAQEIVKSGKIGKLISMRGNWCIFGGPSSSGGALMGLGSYLCNMARFISSQEPTHVSCHCVKSWKQNGVPTKTPLPQAEQDAKNKKQLEENGFIGEQIDESKLEMNDDAAVVALAKFPTFVLTFEASSGGPLSTCFEILGDKGSITFDSPFKPKPEASSLFVRIEKNPVEEIVISDAELHGDIEHLYQIELDELSRLSFKISSTNKVHHEQQQEQLQHENNDSTSMKQSQQISSKSACFDDDDDAQNQNSIPPLSPSEIVGQHLSPQFSISGACVLELMQKSMEQGGVMLATNLQQPHDLFLARKTKN